MYMRLVENLAFLLSVSIILQVILAKARPTGLARSGLYGAVFGALAVLTMHYPVQIPNGGVSTAVSSVSASRESSGVRGPH